MRRELVWVVVDLVALIAVFLFAAIGAMHYTGLDRWVR